jgi:hypothetical protein
MSGWQTMEANLNVGEYAKRVCREIGWPYSGNLTLLCDCITSLAYARGVDVWGGFISLMQAVEWAKEQEIRVDRWFFQDGRYNNIVPTEAEIQRKPPQPEPAVGGVVSSATRKPN